ncbi:MAG: (d)CMP kinase [Pseudomonadota bacterium]
MSGTEVPVITVDGPSGAGKGTLSVGLVNALGFHFLDSGALYRLVAWQALSTQTALDDEEQLARQAATLDVSFVPDAGGGYQTLLAEEPVDDAIRDEKVAAAASRVAALTAVRDALLQRQRDFRQTPGLIADGRDMGTVVFPDAPVKLFITASAEERARRRHKQLKHKGSGDTLRALLAEIRERDERDRKRVVAPLVPAPDALVLDTSTMSIEAVLATALTEVTSRLNLPQDATGRQ